MIRIWPILFIVVPLVELYLIIEVGSHIGALWTVLIVIMTAVIGVQLLRIQGFNTLRRAQQNMAQGGMPAMEMMEGIVLAVGGALLITPGFMTDTLGFLCLVPMTRRGMIRYFISVSSVQMHGFQGKGPGPGRPFDDPPQHRPGSGKGRTLDGEFRREDD
jgi:UPF0716 protein FxsA